MNRLHLRFDLLQSVRKLGSKLIVPPRVLETAFGSVEEFQLGELQQISIDEPICEVRGNRYDQRLNESLMGPFSYS